MLPLKLCHFISVLSVSCITFFSRTTKLLLLTSFVSFEMVKASQPYIKMDVVVVVVVVVVVDPKLLSSSLLYSQCQADESACLLQLV